MNALDAIRTMIDHSDETQSSTARNIGKKPSYISNLFTRGTIPNVERLSLIASGCGYKLILRNSATGDEIEIQSTRTTDDSYTE